MRRLIHTITLTACFCLQSGCKEPEPIRIGFVGELTTRVAGLSTSGRDGFLLAIEEANTSGGIKSQKIEGLVQETRMHKETALQAVRTLVDSKVVAIIGPMTSQTAVTIVP